MYVDIDLGGVNQFTGNVTLTDISAMNKIAVKYKANDFALWVNGVEVLTDTSGSTFGAGVLTNFQNNAGSGILPMYANIQNVQLYPTALSDVELEYLTGTSYNSYELMAADLGYTVL